MPSRATVSVALPLMRSPAKRISPVVRTIMLQIARSMVVLPAPFAPNKRGDAALFDVQRNAVEDVGLAIRRIELVDFEQCGHTVSPR